MTDPQRGRRRDRGAVLPLVALVLPVLVLMTAFAVDLGRQRSSRRTMQARADVVALDMVRLADGRSEYDIINGDPTDPIYAASAGYAAYLVASATRNDIDVAKLEVVWGTWTEASKFVSCGTPPGAPPTSASTTCVPDSVQVTAHETTDYFFQPGSGEATRSAVASVDDTPIGSFSLGSSLARLNAGDAGLLNPFLKGLLKDPALQLGALDYKGLAPAKVTLLDLLDASPSVGTVDELLSSPLTLGQAAQLFLTALTNRGELGSADLAAFGKLATAAAQAGTPEFTLGDIVAVDSQDERALGTDVNAFDLFLAGAQAANTQNAFDVDLAVPLTAANRYGAVIYNAPTTPARATATAPITGPVHDITALSATATPATALTAKVTVIEAPQIAIGPAKQGPDGQWVTRARSANVRVDVQLPTIKLGLGLPLLDPQATVSLPISLSAAGASGSLTDIACSAQPEVLTVFTAPRPVGLLLHADGKKPLSGDDDPHNPNVAHPALADVSAVIGAVPPISPGLRLPIARVTTKVDIREAPGSGDSLAIPVGGSSSAFARGVGVSNMLGSPQSLKVEVLYAGVSGDAVASALFSSLTPALTQIDNALKPMLSLLGARIGESDVQALSAKCERTGVKLVG